MPVQLPSVRSKGEITIESNSHWCLTVDALLLPGMCAGSHSVLSQLVSEHDMLSQEYYVLVATMCGFDLL